ncbi:MAG: aminotransferase class V-fold PLP-dependent enzyme, partial [Candidatus Dormibacteraeota bacterium]|nr:aminotransferase class V-fold PLP-dependent enzyme [Candidatus Dormibacteraeota bacterium]
MGEGRDPGLPDTRALFPGLGDVAFLNHAAASPIAEPVRQAMVEATNRMASAQAPDALGLADRLRGKIGALINADPAGVALTRSTAHGMSLVALGLDWRAGDNVVVADGDYPAAIYPWMTLEPRGVEVRLASGVESEGGAAAILDRVDDHTRLVCVSHVRFASGYRMDVATIGAECRRRGVLFCVDVMQSLGAVAVDARAMHADVVASGGHKWLLGPGASAFCFIRPDLIPGLTPAVAGALSVSDPFRFTDYSARWAPDAHRFEETWLSPPLLAGLEAAVDLAAAVGISRIERCVLGRTRALAEALLGSGMRLATPWPLPPQRTSAIVSFEHPRVPSPNVLEALRSARVVASQRGSSVRLSPHYHNPDSDLERVLDV